MAIINIDFDGTCVTHDFPHIGKEIGGELVLKQLIDNEHQLILFTMRCDHEENFIPKDDPGNVGPGTYLTDAVNWFQKHNIPLYGIQRNPQQDLWTTSPKSWAEYMIDDSAIGTPMLYIPEISSKSFVDWLSISRLLLVENLISLKQQTQLAKDLFIKYNHIYVRYHDQKCVNL